ncbi:MarR family winged helix-turn-helix transcriptional regulator [Nocardia wallacei]|uniref:MarR family winged helix-turn-helix transcriptional regulator n=1 Tax=Nocardia wallacei TaxID=480035 RepID=UPI002456FC47|nr:MarR family transcriptional regulator [Nocardia wallacei]
MASSILDLIIARDGCLAAELAEHFLLDKSTVSRQVAALEREGLLAKEVDPANRRNHILRATTEGKRVAREAERARALAFTDRFRDWNDHDIEKLAEYLVRYNG